MAWAPSIEMSKLAGTITAQEQQSVRLQGLTFLLVRKWHGSPFAKPRVLIASLIDSSRRNLAYTCSFINIRGGELG